MGLAIIKHSGWSTADQRAARTLLGRGAPPHEVAEALGRSETSVLLWMQSGSVDTNVIESRS